MKSVLDQATRDELLERIAMLTENSTARWGTMTVRQMLKHCVLCEEMYLGKKQYKRAFIGRLFGKIALRSILKDDSPMKRNQPTFPEFKILDNSTDVASGKTRWMQLVEDYARYSRHDFIHWFFGGMTKEEVGRFAYKHIDHHLRQFNC